jgi:uncharacterized protein (DUF433 family)
MSLRNVEAEIPLGIGYYTVPEAARLLRIPALNIRRWLAGYVYRTRDGEPRVMPPLWHPQLPAHEQHLELGFRDLIELRFIAAFRDAGLGILTIRSCLEYARSLVGDERPFSTRQFRTDGRTIFFRLVQQATDVGALTDGTGENEGDHGLVDLKKRQYVFGSVIAQTFKDLDLDDDVVVRWRPFRGKDTIVIDPNRAFGQPIAATSGVPTSTLVDAVKAEGSERRVASLFGVSKAIIRDALQYERELTAA